jgi:hypothetical protein
LQLVEQGIQGAGRFAPLYQQMREELSAPPKR